MTRVSAALLVMCASIAAGRSMAQDVRTFRGGLPIQLEGGTVSAIAAADLDGDGRTDAAVTDGGLGAQVLTDLAAAGGGGRKPLEGSAEIVVAGQVDGADEVDLVTTSRNEVTLWRRGTDGSWSGVSSTLWKNVVASASSVALADLDRDGDLDAVLSVSGEVRAAKYTANGAFESAEPIQGISDDAGVSCADFDGDGAPDLMVVVPRGVQLLRGRGEGAFSTPELVPFSPVGLALTAGDFSADGKADAMLVLLDGTVNFLEVTGDLHAKAVYDLPDFTQSIFVPTPLLRATDFDGSGTDDLIVADRGAELRGIRVLMGSGDGTFELELDVPLGMSYGTLSTGDADGDGLGDLLVGSSDSPQIVLFLGEAPGVPSVSSVVSLPSRGRSLGLADVQADGAPDLVIVTPSGYEVLLGDGGGGFEPPREHVVQDALFASGVEGDFDGDARVDLAAADQNVGRVHILSLDRTGGIARDVAHDVGCLPSRLAVADLDVDGRLDVAATCRGGNGIVVILDPADAGAKPRSVHAGQSPTSLAAFDLSSDGIADVVVAHEQGAAVLLGTRDGGLQPAFDVPELALSRSLRAVDVDGDGIVDLAGLTTRGLSTAYGPLHAGVEVKRALSPEPLRAFALADISGDGRPERLLLLDSELRVAPGEFEDIDHGESYAVGRGVIELEVLDLDGDARRDVVVLEADGRDARILRRARRSVDSVFRRGDADGSGKVDITDAITIAGSLFQGAGALACPDAADTDDDGRLLLTDVIFLLLHEFQGGSAPPAPGPSECGHDPTPDRLEGCGVGCGARG